MRARSLKPGFFKNPELGECEPLARILFEGLWCLADREGRLQDRPSLIKVEVLPYDSCDIGPLLDALTEHGLIARYQVDGVCCICIPSFGKHQRPHHMEVPSVLPPPPGGRDKYTHRPITKKQRERIFRRDKNRCRKCGCTETLHIDHIIPVSSGGGSEDHNLQVLCEKCNLSKGGRLVNESRTAQDRPDNGATNLPFDTLTPDSGLLTPDSGLLTPDERPEPSAPPVLRRKPAASDLNGPKADILRVFDHWRERMNHPAAKLDDKREAKIRSGLKLGYTPEQLIRCIDGYAASPHHMGDNDRGTVYDAIGLIFRDGDHIDQGLRFADLPPRPQSAGDRRAAGNVAAVQQFLAREERHGQG